MAMSANGFIAKENNETPWSNEEWESFSTMVQSIGNIVIGRKTYEIMKENNEFEKIGNPVVVVVSNTLKEKSVFVNSPEKAIEQLKEKGFSEVLVAGGGILNSSFVKKGLIDEIYLDIEPVLFGRGISLFAKNDFEEKLTLLGTKKISKDTIQLHYQVRK
tara:strand:- start:3007 stop:3486 length:480 start_codon:yes stop_codon:yes gene_type:complete